MRRTSDLWIPSDDDDDGPDMPSWMRKPVRQLNITFEPLADIKAKRALLLLINNDAESIEDYEPIIPIRSQTLTVAVPKTIRLLRYVLVEHHVIFVERRNHRPYASCVAIRAAAGTVDAMPTPSITSCRVPVKEPIPGRI
jgi:hypothetical protein